MRLAGALELRPALQAILETLVEIHHADYGLLSLYDSASGSLCDAASLGPDEAALEALRRTMPSPSVGGSGSAFATEKRAVVEDTETDPFGRALPARDHREQKATSWLLQMSGHQVVGASDSALEAARQFSAE